MVLGALLVLAGLGLLVEELLGVFVVSPTSMYCLRRTSVLPQVLSSAFLSALPWLESSPVVPCMAQASRDVARAPF